MGTTAYGYRYGHSYDYGQIYGNTARKPVDRPATGQPTRRPMERPATGQPTYRPMERPGIGQPTRKPMERPATGGQTAKRPGAKSAKRKAIKKGSRTIIVVSHEKKARVSLTAAISLLIVFVGALGIVLMTASISNSSKALNAVNNNVKTEQDTIASLQSQLTLTMNLADIEDYAVNKLGMARPKPYQIIHIQVPKQSYVVSGAAGDNQTADTGGGTVLGNIAGLFGAGGSQP